MKKQQPKKDPLLHILATYKNIRSLKYKLPLGNDSISVSFILLLKTRLIVKFRHFLQSIRAYRKL